ncbi:DUF2625 family protein [Plantactinospora sp. WMMC1484]|uniref:DUF2625 family protein n=1 Tax=Plantactinospora sp. WMMC1484 TaxID=3404122 RepID=UPI003BF473B0
MLDLDDLDNLVDDATSWDDLLDVLLRSFAAPRVLPADRVRARASLRQLHLPANSPLGAIALNCGGILLYDGWLRIFGGSPSAEIGLPSIGQVNAFPADVDRAWTPTEGLIVANDVLGGVFFLNGLRPAAGRPGVPGEVIYFDPRFLDWTRTEMAHGEWLTWCVSGELSHFYAGLLWPRWREDVAGLRSDQGIATLPSLWNGPAPAAGATRSVVPMADLLNRQFDAARRRGRSVADAFGRCPLG